MVEVREPLRREALGQLALDDHILHFVAEKFVVDVARHGGLVHSKGFQRTLHPERKAPGQGHAPPWSCCADLPLCDEEEKHGDAGGSSHAKGR